MECFTYRLGFILNDFQAVLCVPEDACGDDGGALFAALLVGPDGAFGFASDFEPGDTSHDGCP